MSKLLSELWASTPLSSTFRSKGVELPMDSESSALMDKSESTPAKCDLRIEGMTCGSCVEVCAAVLRRNWMLSASPGD